MNLNPRRRVLLLVLIMAIIVISVELITVNMLYRTAVAENRARLVETAKSQARLIEAVARFDKAHTNQYSKDPYKATLSQIADAHDKYAGFGETGEFTLSRKENDKIVFLLNHRHFDLNNPKPVPFDSHLAEPMRLALQGKSGTVVGLDYRGETVLAAHEPVSELNLGIVAKIDLAEIRSPFIKAAIVSGLSAIFLIVLGAGIFFRITNPILGRLNKSIADLKRALSEVKILKGMLPICSYCKKVRDDKGYWSQVEVYIKDRSDAEFTHSICPQCVDEHFSK